MTYPTDNAYGRYLDERREEEENFRRNSNQYVRHDVDHQGLCHESASSFGHCSRTDSHYTHEARGGQGNVLRRWRVRKVVEAVDPLIQLPE